MNKKIIIDSLLVFSIAAGSTANAAIINETILDFNSMVEGAFFGFANTTLGPNGTCLTPNCYYEDGMALGIVKDTSPEGAGSHLHKKVAGPGNFRLGYHSDSSGIYIRSMDSSAFSLTSMLFKAPASSDNPYANGTYSYEDENGEIQTVTGVAGTDDYWNILGYSSALNPGMDSAANGGNWIAHQTVTNGFNDVLTLDKSFSNIGALWIHYNGYTQYPTDGKAFAMELDNVKLNKPEGVPIPAAVWIFLSGMMGMLALGKRKSKRAS